MCIVKADHPVPSLTRPERVGPQVDRLGGRPPPAAGLAHTWSAVPVEPWAGVALESASPDEVAAETAVEAVEALEDSGTMSGGL
jgi:hypothetical protein